MKDAQNELTPFLLPVIPFNCQNTPCPFMTDGDEIGNKLVIFEDAKCIVEDW